MDRLKTSGIVNRVISEVGGTIATNGIQGLSREDHGSGVSPFSYVRSCLVATAYNSLRSLPGFGYTYGGFFQAVEHETEHWLKGEVSE